MSDVEDSGSVVMRFPVRWFAAFIIPLFGLGVLQWHSAGAQAVSSQALLEHSQSKHKDAASELDMQRALYVQEIHGEDIAELKRMFGEMVKAHNELMIELRTRN